MIHDLMYIELKTGYSDDGPACVLVQCLCVALRHLLCDPDPSETGHVLRFLLWSNG